MNELIPMLRSLLPADDVLESEPMARHTTFRTGGAARLFVRVSPKGPFRQVLELLSLHKVPHTVIGNGSNLLVSDQGYDGVIVCLHEAHADSRQPSLNADGTVSFSAGMSNAAIASLLKDAGLGGFEFASGIPGTIGGAVVMNAGAYGSEMKDVVTSVSCLKESEMTPGEIEEVTYDAPSLRFRYRASVIKDTAGLFVTRVRMRLTPDDPEEIAARMRELNDRRRDKQPLEYPSAGSTFKRPECNFAGALIEAAGCKGLTLGGAQISEKHAGFLINKDHATASDIFRLMREVQRRVHAHSGVILEPEIVLLGTFEDESGDSLCVSSS